MTCQYGVHIVGRIQLAFGIFSVVSSIGMGPIVKKFGRLLILIIASFANIGAIIILMLWNYFQINNVIGKKISIYHYYY